jgi:flagellar biosynthesis protein FlhG
LVLLTPEPTSLTDAYALIKVLKMRHGVEHFRILVNMAESEREAKDIFTRLYLAGEQFLSGISLDYVGFVPRDNLVHKAVINQKPFWFLNNDGPASRAVTRAAQTVQTWDVPVSLDGNIKFFWKKLLFSQ